ncbi:MAG TPA: hypothetical protein VH008_18970 [Pseudonocardia sp.]|jgi:hypothetical protein|nr:hypothetical protein [Pseudonocardia sp.]
MPRLPDRTRTARSIATLAASVALLWSGGCAAAAPAVPASGASAPVSGSAAPSAQASPPVEAGAVRITGAVRQPGVLTATQLAAIPSQTVAVTFGTDKGSQRHTELGVPLSTVLEQAGPVLTAGRKHDELSVGALVIGADGYQALVSYGELAPALGNAGALLATSQDGAPLTRPRLVLPKDGQGARYVSDVVELHVVHLGPGS